MIAMIPRTNPVDHDTFEIFDGVSDLALQARKLKAVTQAFSDLFTDCPTGADVEEIRNRPETFCYLFDALKDYVCSVEELATNLDNRTGEYLTMKRTQQAAAQE